MVKKCVIVIFTILALIMNSSCSLEHLPQGELIKTSHSPRNDYTVRAYLCSGNATTDFSIRCEVEISETKKCKNIYWRYHQDDVEINWVNNDTIVVSGISTQTNEKYKDVVLNVTKDSFDWRNDD